MENSRNTFAIATTDPKSMEILEIMEELKEIALAVFCQLRSFSVEGKKLTILMGFGSQEAKIFEGQDIQDSWRQALVWARKRAEKYILAHRIASLLLSLSNPTSMERIFSDLEDVGKLLGEELIIKFWEDNERAVVTICSSKIPELNPGLKQEGKNGKLFELLCNGTRKLKKIIIAKFVKEFDFCDCAPPALVVLGWICPACGKTRL